MFYNRLFVSMFCAIFVACSANAAIKVGSKAIASSGGAVSVGGGAVDGDLDDLDDFDMSGMDESVVVAKLEADIADIRAKREECEKQRKGWIAATAVGGAGVVATGVAAIIQNKKLQENKEAMGDEQWNAVKKALKNGNGNKKFGEGLKNFIGGN